MNIRRSTSFVLLASIMVLVMVFGAAAPPVALADPTVASCAPNSGTASISGTVTGPGATPQPFVQVTAYTAYGKQAGGDSTDASGAYQISNLIGGTYILEFRPPNGPLKGEWYSNQSSGLTATPVLVNHGSAVTGINVELEPGARISGKVSGAISGPLQSVYVSVYDSTGRQVTYTYTDASGNYTTPGLPTGAYRILFDGTGQYLSLYYNSKMTLESANVLNVTSPNMLTGINATLPQGGSITGKVTDGSGTPLAGIAVSASGPDSDTDYTNASGLFTLVGLPSGEYQVRARPLSESVNLIAPSQKIMVTAPGTTADVDFTMSPGGTMTGKVTKSDGTPLNAVTLYIGGQDVDYGDYVSTNASGEYTVTALPTGHYFVLFRPSNLIEEAYNNKQFNAETYDPVAVTAGNTTSGIDAVLEEGASISGKVTAADGGAPIDDIFVEVLDMEGRRVETAFTQADGTYQIPPKLRPGQYKVIFNADDRNASCTYVTEYYNDKSTLETADAITVTGPGTITNIDAVLARGSLLFGRLTDEATGAPITNGQVSIVDAAGKHVGFGRLTFLGGWYSSVALPSGQYRLRFQDYDDGYIDEYYDNKLTLDEATPITVTAPNDVTLLDAALAKGGTISGRVTTGDTGQPFRYGFVAVYNLAGDEVAGVGIEADGTYTVNAGLATGNYNVLVIPYDSQSEASILALAEVQGVSPGSEQPGYAPTFFGNLITPKQATPVAVTAPNNTPNIDIVMQRGVWLPLVVR